MEKEYDYIIVGAGLCGMVLAKELVKRNKKVLILERHTFLNKLGSIRHALFFYDKASFARSRQGILIYRAFGVGGTSIVSCGNAVEFPEFVCNKIGIDLQQELSEAKKDSYVKDQGLKNIGKASSRIKEEADKLGYQMRPMPKFNFADQCISCGECYVGCRRGLKWTSAAYTKELQSDRAEIVTHCKVKRVIESGGKAVGVETECRGAKSNKFFAQKVILAAGGLGTPVILQNSGLEAGDNLFVDLFNVTYGVSNNGDFNQSKELTMAVVSDKFYKDEGFVLSPFIDNLVSFPTSVALRHFRKTFRLGGLMGIMAKINDDNVGKVSKNGRIDKEPTERDLIKLKKGSDIAKEILINCGINPKSIFIAKPRGAHPGGTAALGKVVNSNLETRIKNLYVCDCSVLPFAPGLPPILYLIAMTKWFAKRLLN